MFRSSTVLLWVGSLVLLSSPAATAPTSLDPALLSELKARPIGPAGMSGRIADIEAVASQPEIIYVGTAAGGVWKSENGGLSWRPIFDDQAVASIGAVSVFQPNPDIVWVGTGEGNPRNSVSVGNGVYRSLDGGRSWTHLGLEKSERIHRVVLHPKNPDIAYVAALGPTWSDGEQRGVYKTTDGGQSWKRVLFVDEKTGAAELVMDPANPEKLFAAMWEYRRWPWFFRSGGPGSGLYRSVDGGENWTRLTEKDGLPKGDLGRMGIAISASNPLIVYSVVEAEESALLRSSDGGYTFETINDSPKVVQRPFYYADIRVDPERPNRIYNLWSLLTASEDSGKSFEILAPFKHVHPDHHALWINPRDGRHLINGNDGGVYQSRDRGASWSFAGNLPVAQFYHVAVDRDTPYHIYGGMQDNGSWRGPAAIWENGGIRNHHWEEVGFGDGFETLPDPEDSMQGYSMSQQGMLYRWNQRTGQRKSIRPAPPEGKKLRFNWNAALAQDPFEPGTIYFGSQFVHKSTDRGESWTILSPDLTTNNPEWQKQRESGGLTPDVTGAENFTTLLSIAPSPAQPGVLWTGSDDGRLHLTRDGGASWTSVEANLPGVPPNTWIPHVEASPHDSATAFVVLDDHRRGNWITYAYKTTDYGQTFTRLPTEGVSGYALVLAQDHVRPELLFLGTEFGLFFSLDGGQSWMPWRHGVPTTSVMALALHPDQPDLIIATHGRSALILDDITPLRELTPEVRAKPLHLFQPPDAIQYRVKQTVAPRFAGHGEFRGENRPYGAPLSFWLSDEDLPLPDEPRDQTTPAPDRPGGEGYDRLGAPEPGQNRARAPYPGLRDPESADSPDAVTATLPQSQGLPHALPKPPKPPEDEKPQARFEIRDAGGQLRRSFERPVHRGLNRVVWDLRSDPFKRPSEDIWWHDEPAGLELLPGEYSVTVVYGDARESRPLRVHSDPRIEIRPGDRQAKWEQLQRGGRLVVLVADAVERVRSVQADLDVVLEKARREDEEAKRPGSGKEPRHEQLITDAEKLQESLRELERQLWQPPDTKGYIAEEDVLSRLNRANWFVGSSWEAPTAAQLRYLDVVEKQLAHVLEQVNRSLAEEIPRFRARVESAGLTLLRDFDPLPAP